MTLVVFIKADQLPLFGATVQVKAAVRNGHAVKPYTRVQKVRTTDMFHSTERVALRQHLDDKLFRYASGMSRTRDLVAGAHATAGDSKLGVGVDVGELSAPAIDALARAVVDSGANVFVDSGAFGLFKRGIKSEGAVGALDFDAILARYQDIEYAIADRDEAEEHKGSVLFVMPDVVGDQAASLNLVVQHRAWILGALGGSRVRPVIPIQKGRLSLAEAHAYIADVLGTHDFIVGVPSSEEAVSAHELVDFVAAARPRGLHFLGALSDATLAPKLDAIADAGHEPAHLSADGNLLRSVLYGRRDIVGSRGATIAGILADRADDYGSPEAQQFKEDKAIVESRHAEPKYYRGRDAHALPGSPVRARVAYFTGTRDAAQAYAGEDGHVLTAHLDLRNPASEADVRRVAEANHIDLIDDGHPAAYLEQSPELVAALQRAGFDGAKGRDSLPDDQGEITSYAVFSPSQVRPLAKAIMFFKASSIPAGARWITIHPNGPDEKGQPLLIQPNADGSAHVIGGAGGSLNYLKLKHVKSESDHKKDAAAARQKKQAEAKEKVKRDKEAGIHVAKKKAKAAVRAQTASEESDYVKLVADNLGWDKSKIEFPEADFARLSEAAANQARQRFHRNILRQARDAVAEVRSNLLKDADARMTAGVDVVPVTATSDDVISVRDLDPVPTNPAGLGFATHYADRAERQGLDADAIAAEKAERQAKMSEEQREGIAKRGTLAQKIKKELQTVRDPATKLPTQLDDMSKAMELLKADRKLKAVTKKSRAAVAEINDSHVEPKAYVIAADEPESEDAVFEDLSNDLRTIKTRAFLSEFDKLGDAESLGKYLGIGAYNSVNALALAVSGDALVDRSVVDVLGIAGAAQILARRIHADVPAAQAQRIADAMQDFHLAEYMETSAKTLARVKELTDQAAAMEVADLTTATDIKAAQELNAKHADIIRDAHTLIGEALGEMEANAALTLALKRPSDKPLEVSLGKLPFDSALKQARALGLQRGDYQIETVAGNLFLTVTPGGMDRLAAPINRADIEQVHNNLAIIAGVHDEDDWLPEGFASRPDLVMSVKPGVAPRLAESFAPGADLEASLRDYIGGRAADGDNPADIIADVQSADFVKKAGAGRAADYQRALDAVAPLHGADGKLLRAEDMAPAFDGYADAFVRERYNGQRSTINRQKFELDDHAAESLHRALAETPEGTAAYKPIGELDASDQHALRGFFHKAVAKESPEAAALRAELERHEKAEPERKVEDMFGDVTDNPEWSQWRQQRDDMATKVNSGELTWAKYIEAMRGPEKAYEAIQDLVRSRVNEGFAKTYNTLKPGTPIKTGRAAIRNNLTHLDMTDPAARARRQEADRARIDALRERTAGKYAAGSVVDKLDEARAQEDAFNQSQMGFFSSESAPVTAERPLAADERHTLGHVAERQIAGMMGVYGKGFDPKRQVKMFQPSMSGPKNAARQRAIKMLEANKRMVAAFGTGSGKTAIQLGAFSHLQSKGKAKRGLFLVPSIVQGQFAGAALEFLKPGKYDWHVKPGASQAERIAAYKNPQHHFAAMTHAAFRDDMLHLGAKARGVTEREMSDHVATMTPDERKTWMRDLMKAEGIDFDFLSVDEGQATLNRQGKKNSSLANVVDSLSANTPYYMTASADPVKNDASEIYDVFAKMDPERYRDRDAFMRRYGADTVGSRDALRREMARYIYPSKIDPDVKVDRKTNKTPLSAGQKASLAELDKNLASLGKAHAKGGVDVAAARAVSPGSFTGVPPDEHEAIAKDIAKHAGLLKSSAIQRVINTHADNPGMDDAVKHAGDRRGKPGIVFAHSLEAVKQLSERLALAGHKVITVTGSDTAADKERKREEFQAGGALLVASDAAAVGMNAQRGQWVYQYDTPQTAMTHAQRQGRVNRIGQQNDVELVDNVPDHPEMHRARERLTNKYALRDLMTTPMETLDESGIGYYLRQKQVYADASHE